MYLIKNSPSHLLCILGPYHTYTHAHTHTKKRHLFGDVPVICLLNICNKISKNNCVIYSCSILYVVICFHRGREEGGGGWEGLRRVECREDNQSLKLRGSERYDFLSFFWFVQPEQ